MKVQNRDFVVCDFETSTELWYQKDGFARVWLWGAYSQEGDFQWGTDIASFMAMILKHKNPNPIYYFHNLKFDGSYIVNWLLANGYKYDPDLSEQNTFSTCISDMGMWYYIEVNAYMKKKTKYIVKIQDSLKKIPLPVRDIPKAFGLGGEAKEELDYDNYHPIGYQPTPEELSYLYHDCSIVAKALLILRDEGFTKLTQSSDSFYFWKCSLQSDQARRKGIPPEHTYRSLFPEQPIEVDDYIRNAYRGGWTYVNPLFAGRIITKPVQVWDINSMYPAKMRDKYLPSGKPQFFTGKPTPNKYQCYIARIMISFDIKPDHLPTIQLKNTFLFSPTEYITSSKGLKIEMTVTNIDLRLIFAQYDVHSIEYLDGYYFRKVKGVFTYHIDSNMRIKETSTGGKRYLAKCRMNTVYGKTATSPRKMQKIPYLTDGVLKFSLSPEVIEESQYTALGAFITAWARHDIITDAQNNYSHFIYCDTDSLHMLANEDGTNPILPIHQSHIGFYKLEHTVVKSLFLRSKTYIEQYENGDTEIKCAGASSEVKENMDFDNFEVGATYEGKLMPKQVKGGCILVKTTFTIM